MNNLHEYNEFKNKKKTVEPINESAAQLFDDVWKIRLRMDIPVSLVNSYVKKCQNETGEDIRKKISEQEIAEMISDYVAKSFLTIENLPVSIVSNTQQEPKIQTQEAQVPPQTQIQEETPAQEPATEGQPAPAQEAPAQQPAQNAAPAQPNAQQTASKIPQAEI